MTLCTLAIVQVYENERKNAMGHFSHENLLFTDRKRFSRKSTGAQNSSQFPNIELESGWEWLGPWEIEKIGNVDANGWCYAPDFKMMKYPCKKGAHKRNIIDFTRRRRWVRKRRQKQTQVEQESSTQVCTSCRINCFLLCPAPGKLDQWDSESDL